MHWFLKFISGIKLYLSQYLTNLKHKICFTISFISCLYMFRAHVHKYTEIHGQQNFKILLVSDSSSVHHQEFFTVHTAMIYVIQVCWQLANRIKTERPGPALVLYIRSFILIIFVCFACKVTTLIIRVKEILYAIKHFSTQIPFYYLIFFFVPRYITIRFLYFMAWLTILVSIWQFRKL